MSLLFQKPLEINEDNEIKIQKLEEENTDLRNKCNSAKPTLLRSQSAEIEFYKNRISEMEEENKDAIQKIINEIASEVDFDSKLKDKDDLINFIKSNYVDVIKNIKEELELPLDTSNMNLVNALRKSIGLSASKSMIDFKLENDKSNISEKNIEYQNKLERLNKKYKNEIENLKKEIKIYKMNDKNENDQTFEFELEKARFELTNIKQKNYELIEKCKKQKKNINEMKNSFSLESKKLIKENSSFKQEIAELKSKIKEMQEEKRNIINNLEENKDSEKLYKLFDDLSHQMEDQKNEIKGAVDIKSELVGIIFKLMSVNQILESKFENQINKNKELQTHIDLTCKKIQINDATKSNFDIEDLFIQISTLIENLPSNVNEMISEIIKNTGLSDKDKIYLSFEAIVNSFNIVDENEYSNEIIDSNNKLTLAICSQLKFIQDIANCSDIQSWMLSPDSFEQARSNLLVESKKIEEFISKYAAGLVDEPSLFDYLLPNLDPLSLSKNISTYLEKYQETKSQESHDLFIMLLQSITANTILKKFGQEAQKQCAYQSQQIKLLKNELEFSKQEVGEQFSNDYNQLIAKFENMEKQYTEMKNVLNNTKSILRKAAISDNNFESILNCIDKINNNTQGFDPEEYIDELEKKFIEIKDSFTKYKLLKEEEINKYSKQALSLQNEVEQFNDKLRKISQTNDEKIQKLEEEIKNQQNIIQSKQEEIDNFEIMLKEITEKLSIKELEHGKIKHEYKNKYRETKNEYKRIVDNIQREIDEEINKNEKRLHQYQKNQKELEMKNKEKDEIIKKDTEKIQELQEQISELKFEESKTIEDMKVIKEELNDLRSQKNKAELELKLVNSTLASKEDKIKRDKALFDSQMKLRIFTIQSESQSKIDQCRIEYNTQMHEFLSAICHLFKEMVDINQVINQQNVQSILVRVREKLTSLEKLVSSSDKIQQEMLTIKQLLGIPRTSNATIEISNIVKKYQQLSKEVERTDKDSKEVMRNLNFNNCSSYNIREWEDWARRIYAYISDGLMATKTMKEIKELIEDTVNSTISNRKIVKRVDWLKQEKNILIKYFCPEIKFYEAKKNNAQNIKLVSLISVVKAVKMLQVASGHKQTTFKFTVSNNKYLKEKQQNKIALRPNDNLRNTLVLKKRKQNNENQVQNLVDL